MRADKSRAPTQVLPPFAAVAKTDMIHGFRRAAGWSPAEMARQIGMDHSALSRILNGDLGTGQRSIPSLYAGLRLRFPTITFDDLFQIVDDDGKPVAFEPYDDTDAVPPAAPLAAVEDEGEPPGVEAETA